MVTEELSQLPKRETLSLSNPESQDTSTDMTHIYEFSKG